MKKILAILLSALITTTIFVYANVEKTYASTTTISVTASTGDVNVGDTFTISVSVATENQALYAEYQLLYKESKAEYKGCDNSNVSGGSGVLVARLDIAESVPTINYTFKALETGNIEFTIDNAIFPVDIKGETEYSEINAGSATVKVWAEGSDDATLSSLTVGEFALSPSFSPTNYDYNVTVNSSTTSVTVTGKATQGGEIKSSGADIGNLSYGTNTYKLTVSAPRGNTLTYTINIYRPEPATEPPTQAPTEPPTQGPTEPTTEESEEVVTVLTTDLDGTSYYIADVFDASEIPAGFVKADVDYNGTTVGGAHHDGWDLDLLYLIPKTVASEENISSSAELGAFYLYDAANQDLYRYRKLTVNEGEYVLLNPSYAKNKLTGYTPAEVTIDEIAVDGYMHSADDEYVVFYAMNKDGERNWYCYDTVEHTVQRKAVEAEAETETGADSEAVAELESQLSSLAEENDSLKSANNVLGTFRNVILIVAGAMIVILLALVVYLFIRETKRANKERVREDEILADDEELEIDEIGAEDPEDVEEAEETEDPEEIENVEDSEDDEDPFEE